MERPLGFTINGKGFPATEPIVARQGDKVRIRYMNEGLRSTRCTCTASRSKSSPRMAGRCRRGERIDVIIDATEVGTWAFHCHVLTHAERPDRVFGMVTALIVEER